MILALCTVVLGLEADFPFGLNRVVTNVDTTRGLILPNRDNYTYTYATREHSTYTKDLTELLWEGVSIIT